MHPEFRYADNETPPPLNAGGALYAQTAMTFSTTWAKRFVCVCVTERERLRE